MSKRTGEAIVPNEDHGKVLRHRIGDKTEFIAWRQEYNGERQVFTGVAVAGNQGEFIRPGFVTHNLETVAMLNELGNGWLFNTNDEDEKPKAKAKSTRGRKAKS